MPRAAGTMQQALRGPSVGRSSARREHTRSRKGCYECRKRKVKCDETHPICGQCRRSSRSCSIVDGLFRQHPFSFSIGSAESRTRPQSSKTESAGRQDVETVAADASQQALCASHERSVPEEPALPSGPQHRCSGEQILNSHFVEEHSDFEITAAARPESTETTPLLPREQAECWEAVDGNADRDPYQVQEPHYSPLAPLPSPHRSSTVYVSQNNDASEENEISFFLRQFSEGIGRRMDFLTKEQYFSRQVLGFARRCSLIKYAACAVAAKQLGQMSKPQPNMKPTMGQHLVMIALEQSGVDYLWYGAKYYEKAIQALSDGISHSGQTPFVRSPSAVNGELAATSRSASEDDAADAHLVAACIMCQYEELSATTRAWSSHIIGIYELLQVDDRDGDGIQASSPPAAIQSLFWFFVMNDLHESHISQRQTRVDSQDLPLWRRMGVPLDHAGHFIFNTNSPDTLASSQHARDEVTLRALIRLTCKIVSYGYATAETSSPSVPSTTEGREASWTDLKCQLDKWFEGLPPSFRPDIVIQHGNTEHGPPSLFAQEAWFNDNTCAMGVMYYHMARILLLMWKPSTLLGNHNRAQNNFDVLLACRAIEQNLRSHAKEIFSIALGMSNYAMQMHMLQPLYVAGRCLTERSDQLLLVEMLRNIEHDFGLATEYRVNALREEWGME